MENKDNFSFTYSAAQQQEIENIRKKYLPTEENKMEQLRRLHHSASRKAQLSAVILGVIGALILGAGMSLIMTDLGSILRLTGEAALMIGLVVGFLGLGLVALAYPVYNQVLKKERTRIAPEILRLTDELMQS